MDQAPPPGAKLSHEWRAKHGHSLRRVAALIGCSPSMLCHAEHGRRVLSLFYAFALERASGGFVPASSWDRGPRSKPLPRGRAAKAAITPKRRRGQEASAA